MQFGVGIHIKSPFRNGSVSVSGWFDFGPMGPLGPYWGLCEAAALQDIAKRMLRLSECTVTVPLGTELS